MFCEQSVGTLLPKGRGLNSELETHICNTVCTFVLTLWDEVQQGKESYARVKNMVRKSHL